MAADPSGAAFELRLLFLRELGEGHARAVEGVAALRRDFGDVAALAGVVDFFHRVAGTAESVDLGVIGRLSAACVGASEIAAGNVTRKLIQVFEDGLSGVESVLRVERPNIEQLPYEDTLLRTQNTPAPPLASGPSRILVVDDDPFSARLVDSVLRGAGFSSSYCTDPTKALELIAAESPDLIILDVVMPGLDGFDLCRRVRLMPSLQLTPIIFVTRKGDVEQRVRGLSVGGNDYVAKPFEPQELVARVRSHLKSLSELREMAIRDGLTRCYNNKYFKMRLEQELTRARRYGSELTLGMLDIDHFKRINDTFGHPAGDAVLAHLASLLSASVRSTDVVARYGGEEFSFLLIEAQAQEAAIITNRLRERIATHEFALQSLAGNDLTVTATVSIGLAALRVTDTVATFISRADTALYLAKEGGRNQVRVAN